jgi:hypothetical protein
MFYVVSRGGQDDGSYRNEVGFPLKSNRQVPSATVFARQTVPVGRCNRPIQGCYAKILGPLERSGSNRIDDSALHMT